MRFRTTCSEWVTEMISEMTKITAGLIAIIFFLAISAGVLPGGLIRYEGGRAHAQPQNGGDRPEDGKRHGPPPEAIEVCAGLNTGEVCSFESPRGDLILGTCETTRSGEVACVPEGGPPGGPPPSE